MAFSVVVFACQSIPSPAKTTTSTPFAIQSYEPPQEDYVFISKSFFACNVFFLKLWITRGEHIFSKIPLFFKGFYISKMSNSNSESIYFIILFERF